MLPEFVQKISFIKKNAKSRNESLKKRNYKNKIKKI